MRWTKPQDTNTPIMTADQESAPVHFNDYWQVIRARFPIILILFLLTVGSGYFATIHLMPKIYGGTAEIRILRQDQDVEVFKRSDNLYFDPIFFQSEIETIKSQTILHPVIERLKLRESWSQRYLKGKGELPLDVVYTLLLKKYLDVDSKRGSNVLEIKGLSEDPKEAADIANTIAEIYVENRRAYESKKSRRGLEKLAEEVAKQDEIVKAARLKIEELRRTLGVDVLSGTQDQGGMIDLELQNKSRMLDDARFDYEARRVRYEQLKQLTIDRLVDTLPALGLEDQNLMAARQQQLQVEASVAQALKSGLDANHPKVQALQSQLEKLSEQVHSLATGRLTALAIDLEVSRGKMDSLDRDVKSLKTLNREDKSEKLTPFREAQDESKRQQEILDALKIRYVQEGVDVKVEGDPAITISSAVPSDRPIKPILWLNLLLCGIVGLGFGFLIAFFIEYLDTSVKTIRDVEAILGLPVLAIVPQGVKPLNLEDPDTPHAESYRILRAKINLRPGEESSCRSLTALSGSPGEGKSTTLFNLAYVCAQSGQPVVIVDGDLRRPSMHTLLNLPLEHGLADYMVQGGLANDYVKATSVPNLFLLSAGEMNDQSKGMFGPSVMRAMLDELQQIYPLIFVDSPPALGIGDASVICREVDHTILVVQHRRHPREVTLRAKKAIEEVGGKIAGVVLNAVSLKSQEGYYHYTAYSSYYHKKSKGSSAKSRRGTAVGVHPAQNGKPNSENF